MTWAVKAPVESSGQRLVLIMLANHCNSHTWQCNPSHKLLAQECCMGVSTLKTHIKRLDELGFLSIIHKSIDGVYLPNQYMLNIAGMGQNLPHGGSEIDGRVGQNLTDGGSESGRGVGQNLATNQELKPRNEPGIKPNTSASSEIDIPDDLDLQAWATWIDYRKKSGKALKQVSWPAAMKALVKHGQNQMAVVEQSISNGWQGLFDIKTTTAAQTQQSFRERDELAKRKAYEERTGRKWPERQDENDQRRTIDVTPKFLEIRK